ncbi:MAG TPA: hypothetical protein VF834_24030 [Streptosporangiaceae bacterium]
MDDFMAGAGTDQLRRLVREVLAEVLRSAAPAGVLADVPPAARPATSPAAGPALRPATRPVTGPAPRPAVPAMPPSSVPAADSTAPPNGQPDRLTSRGGAVPGQSGAVRPSEPESWKVRISSDDELHAFALRVLKLADNPKLRRDLVGGRVRFSLAGKAAGEAALAVQRIDKGAVTERTVLAAARAGARLVLGPRAVLTPLARDKARALGVPIDKER